MNIIIELQSRISSFCWIIEINKNSKFEYSDQGLATDLLNIRFVFKEPNQSIHGNPRLYMSGLEFKEFHSKYKTLEEYINDNKG